MKKNKSYFMVVSGLFVALGIVLPFFTGNIPEIGKQLLPMHLPVLLCGFVCGPAWGLLTGFLTPLLRSVLFSAPVMFPMAVSMAFELAAYGFLSGFLYKMLPKKTVSIYAALIGAMLGGRVVMGAANAILLMRAGNSYSWQLFMAGAFINAIPGILLQLVLVPLLVMALRKAGVVEK